MGNHLHTAPVNAADEQNFLPNAWRNIRVYTPCAPDGPTLGGGGYVNCLRIYTFDSNTVRGYTLYQYYLLCCYLTSYYLLWKCQSQAMSLCFVYPIDLTCNSISAVHPGRGVSGCLSRVTGGWHSRGKFWAIIAGTWVCYRHEREHKRKRLFLSGLILSVYNKMHNSRK